jgi:hypothetical protein
LSSIGSRSKLFGFARDGARNVSFSGAVPAAANSLKFILKIHG